MTLSLRVATQEDFEFCASLTRKNMSPYLSLRGIPWEPAIYNESWEAFENLLIVLGSKCLGVLRLCANSGHLEIRDLQVAPDYRNTGVGSWAIAQAKCLARSHGFNGLGLRVYAENPAVRLYERHGFQVVRDSGGTLHMHWGAT